MHLCTAVKTTNISWLIGSPSPKAKQQHGFPHLTDKMALKTYVSEEERFIAVFRDVVLASALIPASGGKNTYSWGTIWLVCNQYSLPGLWKSNIYSILLKLAPRAEVHWKMLSLLGEFSRKNFLLALLQSPVLQLVPAVWCVHRAVLKPSCIRNFPQDNLVPRLKNSALSFDLVNYIPILLLSPAKILRLMSWSYG